MRIDTHAHVFTTKLPLVAKRRFTPDRDRTPEMFLALLDDHGLSHGVVIAASFLGACSDYTLAALRAYPERLRATVIVDPGVERAALEAMDRLGVVGVRFNWLGMTPLPDIRSPAYRRLLDLLAGFGWHVEVQIEGERVAHVVQEVTARGIDLVVDHFGLPDPKAGLNCPGFAAVREAVRRRRAWVKLSAPYRLRGLDPKLLAEVLLEEAGPERLLWGSDWPWTQHEEGRSFRETLDWLADWVPDAAARAAILGETPRRLYRFD